MLSSLKLATIRGIPVRLHITLLAVFALMLFRFGWMGIPAGVLLFGSVLLHELGHSVVAQRYGIRIAGIELHLLGGMAMMTEMPRTPKQEILIAAAGPAVSFMLGLSFLALSLLTGASFDFVAPTLIDLFAYGAIINLGMGIFNLVPALPMDGGRIFRAALQQRMGRLRATRIAASVSRVFGVLFIAVGLMFGQLSLALIGGLLFLMVRGEERFAEREAERKQYFDPYDIPPAGGPLRETREEYVDPWGRRWVVVTRLSD
jgi:Zn-dependent protease